MEKFADELIDGLVARPWGQVSPSAYETGRLVALAPWLTGHERRIEFLTATQRTDGGWGGPGGYALVPTLSATDAILTTLRRSGNRAELMAAADRGLRWLFRFVPGLSGADVPDMPAVDLIVASLIDSINAYVSSPRGVGGWAGGARLRIPAGLDEGRLALVRTAIDAGGPLPAKLLHALEVAGDRVRGESSIRPTSAGIGASPAATAAWLRERDLDSPGRRYLESVVHSYGGPVPCGIPITVFELAWTLSHLIRAGIAVKVPGELVRVLRGALAPNGTPAGEGLPTDADTTSGALFALGLLGVPYEPDSLWTYRLDGHFCTWPGEDGFSVTTNAHVLEAFGHYLARRPDAGRRYVDVVADLSALLRDQQRDGGYWLDRWHASPYYATACSVLALARFGADAEPAIRRAVAWLIETQRPDGSWGVWEGTAEETAYALQVLSLTANENAREVARGRDFLLGHDGEYPQLWHDKDLYRPDAIVRAAILAALYLTEPANIPNR